MARSRITRPGQNQPVKRAADFITPDGTPRIYFGHLDESADGKLAELICMPGARALPIDDRGHRAERQSGLSLIEQRYSRQSAYLSCPLLMSCGAVVVTRLNASQPVEPVSYSLVLVELIAMRRVFVLRNERRRMFTVFTTRISFQSLPPPDSPVSL